MKFVSYPASACAYVLIYTIADPVESVTVVKLFILLPTYALCACS